MKISIIGAGIGGLAAACLLAKQGHDVQVFEKNNRVGGKMNQVITNEFRFDTGPSLITMPHILEKLFDACDCRLNDHLELLPLAPICRYFYKDGTRFDCFADLDRTVAEINKFAPHDALPYTQFLDYSATLFRKTANAFIYNPLFSWQDVRNLNLLSILSIDAFSTVAKRVDSSFESEYLRKFFKRFTTYNGSSPYLAPATLNVIPHVELNLGGFYIKGGIYKLAKTMQVLAENLGVEFIFEAEIEQINVMDGKISGLTTKQEIVNSDLVISNSDSTETTTKLLNGQTISASKKQQAAKVEPSCSGYVLLLGTNKKFDQLKHHNLFFSEDYELEFHQIFEDKVMPDDPTIYLSNTSYSDPEHAPDNGSNLFVLINAPYLSSSYNWATESNKYAKKVIRKLEKQGLTGLGDHIVFQKIINPQDFYDNYRSNKGSIYGTSSNNKFSAFVRPRNKSKLVDGLYLVGGSTHPGGGVPLVIQSAFNAVELINRYET